MATTTTYYVVKVLKKIIVCCCTDYNLIPIKLIKAIPIKPVIIKVIPKPLNAVLAHENI